MPWAGPIEFSTGELVLLLLVMVAVVLFVPVVVGTIGLLLYRRRTRAEDRTRKEATVVFLRWAGATVLTALAVNLLATATRELFS